MPSPHAVADPEVGRPNGPENRVCGQEHSQGVDTVAYTSLAQHTRFDVAPAYAIFDTPKISAPASTGMGVATILVITRT